MKENSAIAMHEDQEDPKPLILRRYWIVFFCFTGCFIMFLQRYNLSVAVVAIVNEKVECPVNDLASTNFSTNPLSSNSSDDSGVTCYQYKYDYDSYWTAQFLAAYFYGYAAFQLPVGRFSEKYKCAKQLIGYGVLGSGVLTVLTPPMLDLGPIPFCLTRFLIGVLHASILCCSYTLFAEWLPKQKRGNATTWCNVGFEFGGMVSFFLTGYISSIDWLGWRYSFYLFSIVSFVWFVPFFYMVHSAPEDDPYLSKYERRLVDQERRAEFLRNSMRVQLESDSSKKLVKVPPKFRFKTVLSSGPVWASLVCKFATGLGYYTITTKIPDYLSEVFHMPIKENGLYSAAPFLGILLSKMLCLKLSDILINLNIMSLTNVRKLFQSISMFTPTICLFLLTVKNDDRDLDILLIFLAMFGSGMICAGDAPITAEFSGQLSGSIFGLTNTLGCSNGFLAPMLASFVLENVHDKHVAWNIIFYVAIVVYAFGGIVFIIFAKAEPQPWAQPKFVIVTEGQPDAESGAAKQKSLKSPGRSSMKIIN